MTVAVADAGPGADAADAAHVYAHTHVYAHARPLRHASPVQKSDMALCQEPGHADVEMTGSASCATTCAKDPRDATRHGLPVCVADMLPPWLTPQS